MNVRRATRSDRETLLALWDEFAGDSPPPWVDRPREGSAAGIEESIRLGSAFLAERDGDPVGFASALPRGPGAVELTELYVRPHARGDGIATALVREVLVGARAGGAEHILVSTAVDNDTARTVYEHWGFRPLSLELVARIADVEQSLRARAPRGS